MRLNVEQLTPDEQDSALSYYIEGVFLSALPPKHIGIAVSGGGDSMALLYAAWRYCSLVNIPLSVVTVDHGLRDEAVAEAAMVADYCENLGVPHTTLRWNGNAATGNTAAAGRDARYRLIAEWAQDCGVDRIFLGHTRDDVAETFLMRLARKSGVDGLAMMQSDFHRDGVAWNRPFLYLPRKMLRDYLLRHGVAWVDDPTNEDDAYDRPKARKALAALAPLGITVETLCTVAVNQLESRFTLEHYTRQEADRVVSQQMGDIVIERRVYPSVPTEIEHRLLVSAFKFIGSADYPPRSDAMLDLEIGLMQVGKHTLAGCLITRDKHHTRITRERNAVKDMVTATHEVWDNRWAIEGPHAARLTIRALGDSLKDVPDWRAVGLPRSSLLATPAVFDGETLISAPVAGLQNGFEARIVADFHSFLLSR